MATYSFVKRRERARRYAMQALYSWHISDNQLLEIEKFYLEDRNPDKFDVEYFKTLLHEIPKKVADLNEAINPLIKDSLDSLPIIEVAILQIATYEFQSCLDVPYRVVIDQALELTKMFGSEDSLKLVNGVLNTLSDKYRAVERSS